MAKDLLTAKFVEQALAGKAALGRHADGDRLYLTVREGRVPSWLFRYTAPSGKKRDMGLGEATTVGLAAARRLADEAREMLSRGVDPLDARDNAQAEARAQAATVRAMKAAVDATLARVARAYHERIEAGFRNPKHRAQWINSLEQHVPADLWKKPVADIEAHELLDFLTELQDKVPETAKRVRQRLEAVFDDAVVRKLVSGNPAMAVRRHLRAPKSRTHFAALDWREVPAFVKRLQELPGASARALEFGILTAARTSEILGATWGEIDMEARTWIVPASRMKRGEEHHVHLSERAIAILKGQSGWHASIVFPSVAKENSPMSGMAMLTLLRRLGVADQTTVHGLCRSTFSTWANERGFRPDVIEASLAHREADRVRAAYNKAQFLAERVELLDAWANFVTGTAGATTSTVVSLRGARAARGDQDGDHEPIASAT